MRTRGAVALTIGLLMVGALAGCTGETDVAPPTTTGAPSATTETAATPFTNAPGQIPEDTVTSYFKAFDTSAADGWKDISYNAAYLTPDLAVKADADDEANRATGSIITGPRHLSEMTVLEETDTGSIVEFCNDTSEMVITKDGAPVDQKRVLEGVGRFTLTRGSTDEPWLISEKAFYPEGTTCADHFAQYDQ